MLMLKLAQIQWLKAGTLNIYRYLGASTIQVNPGKKLYKHLLRQCLRLPTPGPREHYKFMINQGFKQYVEETDPVRIKQIIERSYEDCEWILKKYKVK